MTMNLERAKKIAIGYMSPRNEAINIFAQQGKVTEDLVLELKREIVLKNAEVEGARGDDQGTEYVYLLDFEELDHLVTWLTYSYSIVDIIDGNTLEVTFNRPAGVKSYEVIAEEKLS